MLTKEEKERWKEIVLRLPAMLVEEWIRELHGEHVTEFDWIVDAEPLPHVSFLDDTHCCGVSLFDPPGWIVFRVMWWASFMVNQKSSDGTISALIEKKLKEEPREPLWARIGG